MTLLHWVVRNADLEVVKSVVAVYSASDLSEAVKEKDNTGLTVLLWAGINPNLEVKNILHAALLKTNHAGLEKVSMFSTSKSKQPDSREVVHDENIKNDQTKGL